MANDRLAIIIKDFLKENNVSLEHVKTNNSLKSNLALAFLDDKNNAEYSFYKSKLEESFNYPKYIQKGDLILFGSSFALKAEYRNDLLSFLYYAKKQGALIVYDPNYRSDAISSLEDKFDMIKENFSIADIVKGSNEDFYNIFNQKGLENIFSLLRKYTKATLVLTSGSKGISLINKNINIHKLADKINCVSTIGAGDTVSAALLYCLERFHVKAIDDISIAFCNYFLPIAIEMSQEVCLKYENYISKDLARKIIK